MGRLADTGMRSAVVAVKALNSAFSSDSWHWPVNRNAIAFLKVRDRPLLMILYYRVRKHGSAISCHLKNNSPASDFSKEAQSNREHILYRRQGPWKD